VRSLAPARGLLTVLGLAGPAALAAVACGSRTGLLAPGAPAPDSGVPGDADAEPVPDSPEEPPIEDSSLPDVPVIDVCPDAGATLIYVITQQGDLYSFYPPTLAFHLIGSISCTQSAAQPFSMAVGRTGIAYSVFNDGTLHIIDMATAACKDTAFVPDQQGFGTFGMGFVANTGDAGETLFVAEGSVVTPRPNSRGLGTIDPATLALSFVASFNPPIPGPELTGTGSGQLFGFYTNASASGSHIVQIDPGTGKLLADYPLVTGAPNDGYAFAYWGGVFWVFTDPSGSSTTVTRFDPVTMSETDVATLSDGVVGAGVSTCAPQ
jgi:hypothetical protein